MWDGTYKIPVSGSKFAPGKFAPPPAPGKNTVASLPSVLGAAVIAKAPIADQEEKKSPDGAALRPPSAPAAKPIGGSHVPVVAAEPPKPSEPMPVATPKKTTIDGSLASSATSMVGGLGVAVASVEGSLASGGGGGGGGGGAVVVAPSVTSDFSGFSDFIDFSDSFNVFLAMSQ